MFYRSPCRIGIGKKAQSISVDPSRPTSKRTRDYDDGPQASAAAWLSAQRLRSERPRFLSDASRLGGEPPAWVVPVGTRIAAYRPRSARGDGALRCGLAPFGIDVTLSDLYPDKYSGADGYVTSKPLDASDLGHLRCALELAGAGCTAVITNTPHNTDEACAIVINLVALVEAQRVDFVAALFRAI